MHFVVEMNRVISAEEGIRTGLQIVSLIAIDFKAYFVKCFLRLWKVWLSDASHLVGLLILQYSQSEVLMKGVTGANVKN